MNVRQFVKEFRREHNRQRADNRNAPKVGDVAPDFELLDTGGHPIRLSDLHRQRPVALLFGSFT